ncbi:HIT domain-containing protein [Candidatus Mycoplasma haematominutum]|uniref:HIT domain-containing protein n=1 Tax=Candidatus Mycoplasma haematominutum TaxID=209446 RepID=UPI0002F7782C|nr:HIT family protein [Candidatus Mycoplasma haematominutum]
MFCAISASLQSQSNLILEGKHTFVIPDIKPISKGHALVITKAHFQDLSSSPDEALAEAIALAKEYSKTLKAQDASIRGFNFVSNQGAKANQVVFHFHLHIIPRY